MAAIPGRTCPVSYGYLPGALARPPTLRAEALYVAGGVYGNEQALAEVLRLQAAEPGAVLVFNGDFHWFDSDPARFERVQRAVLAHIALRGNVETELAGEDATAGCGCGYPDWVADAEVERSNAIMARLRATAHAVPLARAELTRLPAYKIAEVGGMRVAIVHGDLESIAGWGLAQETASDTGQQAAILSAMRAAALHVVASSHTCLPLLLHLADLQGESVVINNGAAGMPNFGGTRFGLLSRIATTPCPHTQPLYATQIGAVHVEALALHYDHDAFVRAFTQDWPPASAAQLSYGNRIERGPPYRLSQAWRRAAFGASYVSHDASR
jgi:hypothetical protein